MFETEVFVADRRNALKESNPQAAVRAVVERSVVNPNEIIQTLGEPTRAEAFALHRSDDLTIINFVWGPHMALPPHDHRMWAVIGLYGGKEANAFYRRSPGGLEPNGSREPSQKDTCPLGRSVIHSVVNPLGTFTGAIHVYGGDFFSVPKSQWDADGRQEKPYDVEYFMQLFEESNRTGEESTITKGSQ